MRIDLVGGNPLLAVEDYIGNIANFDALGQTGF